MSSVCVTLSDKNTVCTQHFRGGLVAIHYDVDHEIVAFEAIDPISVGGNIPVPTEVSEQEQVNELVDSFCETEKRARDQVTPQEMETIVRIVKKLADPVFDSSELQGRCEAAFKAKRLELLVAKHAEEIALLSQK